MARTSSSWPSCSLLGRRLSYFLQLHWRNLVFLIKDQLNILPRVNYYPHSINCNRSFGDPWWKNHLMLPCIFKDFLLVCGSDFPMKCKDIKHSSVKFFPIKFDQFSYLIYTWAKTKDMSFKLTFHTTWVMKDLLVYDFPYLVNHLVFVSLFVFLVTFVWNRHRESPTANLEGLCAEVGFEEMSIHWRWSNNNFEIFAFL